MTTQRLLYPLALLSAWLIALTATLATLYASEILHLAVCTLCWYQRICIYPLAVILGIAAFREDYRIGIYTIPLALIGALFALYQYLEQIIPGFAPIAFCSNTVSCSQTTFKWLGFITFPLLSLVACLVIIALLSYSLRKRADFH